MLLRLGCVFLTESVWQEVPDTQAHRVNYLPVVVSWCRMNTQTERWGLCVCDGRQQDGDLFLLSVCLQLSVASLQTSRSFTAVCRNVLTPLQLVADTRFSLENLIFIFQSYILTVMLWFESTSSSSVFCLSKNSFLLIWIEALKMLQTVKTLEANLCSVRFGRTLRCPKAESIFQRWADASCLKRGISMMKGSCVKTRWSIQRRASCSGRKKSVFTDSADKWKHLVSTLNVSQHWRTAALQSDGLKGCNYRSVLFVSDEPASFLWRYVKCFLVLFSTWILKEFPTSVKRRNFIQTLSDF